MSAQQPEQLSPAVAGCSYDKHPHRALSTHLQRSELSGTEGETFITSPSQRSMLREIEGETLIDSLADIGLTAAHVRRTPRLEIER